MLQLAGKCCAGEVGRKRNLYIMLEVFTAVGGQFVVFLYMTLQTGWTVSIFRLEFSYGCSPTECARLHPSA
jgi:hypothetical protein